jgi:hypothetical protein
MIALGPTLLQRAVAYTIYIPVIALSMPTMNNLTMQ